MSLVGIAEQGLIGDGNAGNWQLLLNEFCWLQGRRYSGCTFLEVESSKGF